MTKGEYREIEAHMRGQMSDSAHDVEHVVRVLHTALAIAAQQAGPVDTDVLVAACLLHDIGRARQFADPALCHAQVGGQMAWDYLRARGWSGEKARAVRQAIAAHRYRSQTPPESLEAIILFDADKLDVTGALGIARTFLYEGAVGEPIYLLDEEGGIVTGGGEGASFFQEYNTKLKAVYEGFYTPAAKAMAARRRAAAEAYYNSLYAEVNENTAEGRRCLANVLAGE